MGPETTVMAITYSAAGLAPNVVYIPKEEYSLEREKQLIREDIAKRLKGKPETYTVKVER